MGEIKKIIFVIILPLGIPILFCISFFIMLFMMVIPESFKFVWEVIKEELK